MNLEESLQNIEYLSKNPDVYKDKRIIYLLECKNKEVTDKYIGCSKTYEAAKKMFFHGVKNVNNPKNYTPVLKCIRKNGGLDNWIFKPIEFLDDTHKPSFIDYLRVHYIHLFKTSLNHNTILKNN